MRALRETFAYARLGGPTPPLETLPRGDEPPRLEAARPLEREDIVAIPVGDAPIVGIAAFLDGIQRSGVVAHVGHVPVVHASVAAAVRVRVDRRLRAWSAPIRSQALYLPVAALTSHDAALAALAARCDLRDTGAEPGSHPQEFTARALAAVQRAREGAEAALAERWVAHESSPLLIDGGIRGLRGTATHALAIGVVKSHRTLYVEGESLPVVLGLREGERTSAMSLETANRVPVMTWYLRLRGDGGRSPLFGLVRIEVAHEAGDVAARADLVSRWVLAERAPVSLPDPRWDVMVYGIRECEQYLAAVVA